MTKTVAAFPNPASNIVNLKSSIKIYKWKLIDALGKEIWVSDKNSKEISIDLRNFDAGICFLNSYFNDVVTTTKIVHL